MHTSTEDGRILRQLMRGAGIFILVNVLAFAVHFLFLHWPPPSFVQLGGLGVLLLLVFLLVHWLLHRPESTVRVLTTGSPPAGNRPTQLAEFVAVRLLGLYLMIQALGELAHIVVYKTAFAYQLALTLSAGLRAWIETNPGHSVSLVAALFKALAGVWLLLGTRRIAEFIRWTRTAGRVWEDDTESGDVDDTSPPTNNAIHE